jgi:polysaccharide biosynthesis/export protein
MVAKALSPLVLLMKSFLTLTRLKHEIDRHVTRATMVQRRSFLLLLGAGVLAACNQSTAPVPASLSLAANGPYTLASGDRLRIIVFGQDSLSNSYIVDGSGHISMPLIGPVSARGLTTQELERSVEAKLRNGFVREPRVAAEVEQYRPFFILGEVLNSGQYPFVNGMTVQTAVAIAGGFTPRAVRNTAELTRQVAGEPQRGDVPISFAVKPGDTIVIRERWF